MQSNTQTLVLSRKNGNTRTKARNGREWENMDCSTKMAGGDQAANRKMEAATRKPEGGFKRQQTFILSVKCRHRKCPRRCNVG